MTSPREDGLTQLSRSVENGKRIKSIQDKFVNGQFLQQEGRALVGEGILTKICRKKPKQRAFFLFNDILVYGRVVINGRRYSQQKIIPLHEMKIVEIEDTRENQFSWLIGSPKKSFIVCANSDRERQEWLTHLERCINNASLNLGRKSDTVAAVWLPDDYASVCMHCKASKFSTYNRRHHCRNCGFIVCDSCSKNRFLLQHIDSKAVRVCDTCFLKLASQKNNTLRPTKSDTKSGDSSDSDGEETGASSTSMPATFYENIGNL